jgi:hypothetical protein
LLVQAGEAPPAAEAAYRRGKQLFKLGDKAGDVAKFTECAAEFERAYNVMPQARFSYNAAQCHRRAGAPAAAILWYKRYLTDDPSAKDREKVEARIAELEKALAAAPVEPPKPPEKAVDLTPVAPAVAPTAAPIVPPPPPPEEARPVYKRWWFWTAMAAVAGGAAVGIVMATSGDGQKSAPNSDLGTFDASFR